MGDILHIMQLDRKLEFARHAMVVKDGACEIGRMKIRLSEHRNRLGLNQDAMAERTGFSTSQISRWETGESNIPSKRLPDLAKAYECRISEIFADDEEADDHVEEERKVVHAIRRVASDRRKLAADVAVGAMRPFTAAGSDDV